MVIEKDFTITFNSVSLGFDYIFSSYKLNDKSIIPNYIKFNNVISDDEWKLTNRLTKFTIY